MKRITLLVLVLTIVSLASAATLRHFHVHQIDYTSFTVTCDNGADPTGKKEGNALIISCGK